MRMSMTTPVLKYYDISPDVIAFSTTRHGGYSKGDYASFNANMYCGDREADVIKNREALCEEIGIPSGRLILPHQTHGTVIRSVDETLLCSQTLQRNLMLEGVDGVMTDLKRVCVGVSTADCIPIVLYDVRSHACCAVHAGWRGTVKRIIQKAVVEMTATYGTEPASLHACIGPGISLENFEVGDEVWQKFSDAGFDMERISLRKMKWHIDLWECNRIQLTDAGVNPRNIQVAGICTYSHADEFFSARKLSIHSGRILTGIYVK
jgi:YfiH family protein